MSKGVQAVMIVLLIVVAFLGGWVGYSIGAASGKRVAVREIQGEADFIRQQARNGVATARAFCQAYRNLRSSLGEPLLEQAFQPLRNC